MTEELPRIVWQNKKYRLVEIAKGKFRPEKRLPDDAMGQPAWQFTQWGLEWANDCVKDMLSAKEDEEEDDGDV